MNYVLGGFASSSWNSSDGYINDQNAFLFSLRRNGVSYKDKFIVKNVGNAFFGSSSYGPTFEADHNLFSNTYFIFVQTRIKIVFSQFVLKNYLFTKRFSNS